MTSTIHYTQLNRKCHKQHFDQNNAPNNNNTQWAKEEKKSVKLLSNRVKLAGKHINLSHSHIHTRFDYGHLQQKREMLQ